MRGLRGALLLPWAALGFGLMLLGDKLAAESIRVISERYEGL